MGVDTIVGIVVVWADRWIFPAIYSKTKHFFPTTNLDRISKFTNPEKKAFLATVKKFPKQRAIYSLIFSLLKIIPSSSVIVYYWDHGLGPMEAILKIGMIALFTFNVAAGLVYIENHTFISDMLKDIHEKFDWSPTFREDKASASVSSFFAFELVAFAAIWFFLVALQVTVVSSSQDPLSTKLWQIAFINLAGFIFIGHLGIAGRKQLFYGIQNIIDFYQNKEESYLRGKSIPVSTSPLLSHFQITINDLIEKIHRTENEMSGWVLHLAEKRRYKDLGQLSGLIVHDLSSPIHTINFCADELLAGRAKDEKLYYQRIKTSIENAWDLVTNLKNNIRNPSNIPNQGSIQKAHQSVVKIVKATYSPQELSALRFEICVPDEMAQVSMPQTELNQIFNNLYSNSIRNMISHDIEDGRIRLSLNSESSDCYNFKIADNGSGLSLKKFEYLTADFEQMPLEDQKKSAGIGLKLTRRLVEQYGGSLTIEDAHPSETGTFFNLTLRKVHGQPKAKNLGH